MSSSLSAADVRPPEGAERTRYVMFDVGGVMVVPRPSDITGVVSRFGAEPEPDAIVRAHYAAVNQADSLEGFDWDVYQRTLIRRCGVPDERIEECLVAMYEMVRVTPDIWNHPLPGVRDALAALQDAGLGVAVISNSDGTAARVVSSHGFCQVGEGDGVEIPFVVDSAIVGVEKPDPAIFLDAAARVGLPPEDIAYVGDTRAFDVAGALAAGMRAVHVDPFGDCPAPGGHEHVTSIQAVPALFGASTGRP